MRDYHEELHTVLSRPAKVKYDEAFYVSMLLDLRECWAELEEKSEGENPSIKQMFLDVLVDLETPRSYYLPQLEIMK